MKVNNIQGIKELIGLKSSWSSFLGNSKSHLFGLSAQFTFYGGTFTRIKKLYA